GGGGGEGARRGGVQLLEEAQAGELDLFGGVGRFLRLPQDRGEPGVQDLEALTPFPLLLPQLAMGVSCPTPVKVQIGTQSQGAVRTAIPRSKFVQVFTAP